ncbi:MAG: exodeoxyribonuclease VII large subunit [Planctomycetota bacterium]
MARGMRDGRRASAMESLTPSTKESGNEARPQSVTEITRVIKRMLEDQVGRVWIEGEISNLSMPRSGHIYLTLKDDRAAIGGVMWRSAASRLKARLEDGMRVVVRGSLAVYEPQGRYQVVCDSIRPLGQGDLQARFEELKARLEAEGLFLQTAKQELPALPTCVGIVTSATGAAVQDMMRILRRRLPSTRIILSPCPVQGAGAEEEIARALERLDQSRLCDVILLGRGGGSLEDLWCFNEERVIRAVHAAQTPVISAVGHETDITLCDLVADVRAATPSEAAEMAVPEREELMGILQGQRLRLRRGLLGYTERAQLRIQALAERPVLRSPLNLVNLKSQRLDELTTDLHNAMAGIMERSEQRLSLAAAQLEALSPLAVLSRGYSATWDLAKQRLVRKASDVTINAEIETLVAQGRIRSRVTAIEEKE